MTKIMMRILTGFILLVLLMCTFLFFTPILMAAIIIIVYGYAFFIEYIFLSHRSFKQSPWITVCVGAALFFTGVIHTFWIYNPDTHLYLFLCIGTAVLSDIGGYIVGTLCGRHLLVPSISPKKTWEGFAGSVILVSLACMLCIHNHLIIGIFGAMLALAALAGDLLFSYLKRVAGVKDTGTILPGHGGLLDRLDSIVGTTIALFIIILLFQPFYQINLFY